MATTKISALTELATAPDTGDKLVIVDVSDTTDAATGTTKFIQAGNLGFISDLVDDTTPQLGGTLDANGNTIDMGVNVITDAKVATWDSALLPADIGATVQAYDAGLAYLDGLNFTDEATFKAGVNLEIGTDVQAYDAGLAYLDGLNFTNEATFKAGVNLEIGIDVQAYDADLASWASVTRASGFDTFAATPSSANLASLVTGETGSGALVFGTSPALTAPTITGTIIEDIYTVSGTTPALEPGNGSVQTWTLTGNSTPTDSFAAGEAITLMIDDGTAYTITWPTMTWVNNGGSAPTLATTGYTVVVLWKVSTTLYGALVGDGS